MSLAEQIDLLRDAIASLRFKVERLEKAIENLTGMAADIVAVSSPTDVVASEVVRRIYSQVEDVRVRLTSVEEYLGKLKNLNKKRANRERKLFKLETYRWALLAELLVRKGVLTKEEAKEIIEPQIEKLQSILETVEEELDLLDR